MKKTIQIKATVDEPGLLELMVERLAYRRTDLGFGQQQVQTNAEALETASAEIYLSGSIELTEKETALNIPYITSFLFTCIKGKSGIYQLAWSSSMS